MTVDRQQSDPQVPAQRTAGESGLTRDDPLAVIVANRKRPRRLGDLPALLGDALRLVRRASPRLLLLSAGLQLFVALAVALQVLAAKVALDTLLDDGGTDLSRVLPALAGLVALTSASGLAVAVQAQVQRLLGECVQRETWRRLLDVTTAVDLLTFESADFYDHLQRVRTNAMLRPLTLATSLVGLFGGFLGAAALVVALVVIHPVLPPLLLVAAGPLWWLSKRGGKLEFAFQVKRTPWLRQRSYLERVLTERQQAAELRAFAAAEALRQRHTGLYDAQVRELARHVRRRAGLALLGSASTGLVLLLTLTVLVGLVDAGRLDLAGAGAAILAVRLLATRLEQLGSSVSTLFESGLFLGDLKSFLALQPNPASERAAVAVGEGFDRVELRDVTFRYPGSERAAVADVSLTLRRGEVVALVGENGSGKTTLSKLLAGLYEPTAGRVLWDGVDRSELELDGMRRRVAVVFQDFQRYHLPARENVGLGMPSRLGDLGAIRAAAAAADVDGVLGGLPQGYDTILTKEYAGGTDLSGGQWQRVALARAYLRDAPLLVLDEPTSALDPRAERALFDQVRRLAAGRTVVLVSHRLASVRSADRILVMQQGRLVEQGSHDELIAQAGLYAELTEMQAAVSLTR